MGCSKIQIKNWKFIFHLTWPPAANHSLALFSKIPLDKWFWELFFISVTWDWTVVKDSLVDEFQFYRILNLDFVVDAVLLLVSRLISFSTAAEYLGKMSGRLHISNMSCCFTNCLAPQCSPSSMSLLCLQGVAHKRMPPGTSKWRSPVQICPLVLYQTSEGSNRSLLGRPSALERNIQGYPRLYHLVHPQAGDLATCNQGKQLPTAFPTGTLVPWAWR